MTRNRNDWTNPRKQMPHPLKCLSGLGCARGVAFRRRLFPFIVAVALSPAPLLAESLEEIARGMMERQVAGWNAMDAEQWAADFSENSDFVNIIAMHFTNRAQNVQRHAFLFETIFEGSTLDADILRVRALTDDVALVHTRFSLRGHRANPPGVRNTETGVLKTHISFVLQRIDDEWRIVAAQNTAIGP